MINIEFPQEMFILLDEYYEKEWEALIRPSPSKYFEWHYAVFDGDKCINCPITWTAIATVAVTGFEIKFHDGQLFKSIGKIQPINMITKDTLKLEEFSVYRSIYGNKPSIL